MKIRLHAGIPVLLLASSLVPILMASSQPSFAGVWRTKMNLFISTSDPVARGGKRGVTIPESTVPYPDAEVGGARGGSRPPTAPGLRGNPNAAKEITVKITLKIRLENERVTGNLTFDESGGGLHFPPGIPQEIHDGEIAGNVLKFRTVSSNDATFSNYVAMLDGNKLSISRMQVIDQGELSQFTMLRSK